MTDKQALVHALTRLTDLGENALRLAVIGFAIWALGKFFGFVIHELGRRE